MTKEGILKISVFAGGILFSSLDLKAFEIGADSAGVYKLEAVSVTGSRVPASLGQSARMVTVLDSVSIASMPVKTINDVLKYMAGADVRQRGAFGMQTDISLRGGTHDQIAVLLNGINISDPHTGHNAADFPVDMNEIDRIEIIEGPAARVYGTSSLVGAINIVTKAGPENSLSLRTEGGSFGFFNAGARVSLSSSKLYNQISASFSRSDGYSRNKEGGLNSDFKAAKAFYQGEFQGKDVLMKWQAGLSGKGFGSNTFYSAKFDNQFEKTLKTFTAFQAETKGFFRFKPAVYWNRSQDSFELIRGDASKIPFNHHLTNVFGLNLGGFFETMLGKTAIGAEMRVEDIISTNLGEALSSPISGGSDIVYKKGLNRTSLSYYIEHNAVFRNFTFSAGLAAVGNTGKLDNFRLYPGVDMSYRFLDNWKLYASYNTSYRLPTFTELYYSVGGHKADKNLREERMQAAEAGLKYMRRGVRVIASLYYHLGSDMIDWIKDLSLGEAAQWTSVNHTRLNTFGQEVSLRFDLPSLLGREDFFLRNINLSYSHIKQDKQAGHNIQSRYAMEYLRNKFVAQTDFRIFKNLFMNISYSFNDRVGGYELFKDGKSTDTKVDYVPYSLLDAGLSWSASSYRIYLEANNILNKTYFDHGNVPQPGLWIRAGVALDLRFRK